MQVSVTKLEERCSFIRSTYRQRKLKNYEFVSNFFPKHGLFWKKSVFLVKCTDTGQIFKTIYLKKEAQFAKKLFHNVDSFLNTDPLKNIVPKYRDFCLN